MTTAATPRAVQGAGEVRARTSRPPRARAVAPGHRPRHRDSCVVHFTAVRKRNPVLIGEPGVGKTAVEGLAQRIVKGDVPQSPNKRLGAMVAGANRGEFEGGSRPSSPRSRTPTAGSSPSSTSCTRSSAAPAATRRRRGNMLKPTPARGQLRMVGATTLDEYLEKRTEKHPALSASRSAGGQLSSFSRTLIAILRGLKGRYQAHHKVQIADAALVAAATLSTGTSPRASCPTRPSTSSTQAASRLRMEIDSSRRSEIDELQRAVDRLRTGGTRPRQGDPTRPSAERLQRLRRDLADKEEELRGLTARWSSKQSLNRVAS